MTSSTQVYSGELRDTAIISINIQKAFQHRSNIDAIEARVRSGELGEIDGARPCLKECTAGIDLLKAGSALGSREVLNVLSQLRLMRAGYLNMIMKEDSSHTVILAASTQQFEDSTAVIDLAPAHSTPEMVRCARNNRMFVVGYLKNSLKVPSLMPTFIREKKIALEDSKIQVADPDATAEQKAFAAKFAADLKDVVRVFLFVFIDYFVMI